MYQPDPESKFSDWSIDYCKFQEEYKQKIINLSDSEIESEYEKIHLDDQALRGGEASKENDYKNLIKISCLVSKYGIPTKFMSKEAQMSPSIVIIHAPQIFTYSFLKYYKEAYENGKIEESKFHFFLFACYKAIFDYSFVDTKDNDMQQEIEMILERISKNKPDMMFSLDNICKAIIEFEDNLMYKD